MAKEYSLYCETERALVNDWALSTPKRCPNGNSHVLDHTKTAVVRVTEPTSVFIQSVGYQGTQGYYQMKGGSIDVPTDDATQPGVTTTSTEHRTFKVPVALLGMRVHCTSECIGDSFDVCINPDIAVGVLVQPSVEGSTVHAVSATVIEYAILGVIVSLVDPETGVRTSLGTLTRIDVAAGTITCCDPVPASAGALGSVVCFTFYIARNVRVTMPGTTKIGYATMGAKAIPVGTVACIEYRTTRGSVSRGARQVGYEIEYTF